MNLKLLKYNVMVRKIKFRGKDIDTGEWRYGYLSFFYTTGRDKNGFILTDKAQIYSQEDGRCYDVLAETVGQFTGLLDKKKQEIYEHDIINVNGKYPKLVKYIDDYACFCLAYVDDLDEKMDTCYWQQVSPEWWNSEKREIKKIGNIFDNPNLQNNEENNVQ